MYDKKRLAQQPRRKLMKRESEEVRLLRLINKKLDRIIGLLKKDASQSGEREPEKAGDPILRMPIPEFSKLYVLGGSPRLGVRMHNCLLNLQGKYPDVKTVGDLAKYSDSMLLKETKNFGLKCLNRLNEIFSELGIPRAL